MERVAEWLRLCTRDQGVWGSIPAALVMYKSLGQAMNLHRLCSPSSNSNGKKKCVNDYVYSCRKWLHIPQGDDCERVSSNNT